MARVRWMSLRELTFTEPRCACFPPFPPLPSLMAALLCIRRTLQMGQIFASFTHSWPQAWQTCSASLSKTLSSGPSDSCFNGCAASASRCGLARKCASTLCWYSFRTGRPCAWPPWFAPEGVSESAVVGITSESSWEAEMADSSSQEELVRETAFPSAPTRWGLKVTLEALLACLVGDFTVMTPTPPWVARYWMAEKRSTAPPSGLRAPGASAPASNAIPGMRSQISWTMRSCADSERSRSSRSRMRSAPHSISRVSTPMAAISVATISVACSDLALAEALLLAFTCVFHQGELLASGCMEPGDGQKRLPGTQATGFWPSQGNFLLSSL